MNKPNEEQIKQARKLCYKIEDSFFIDTDLTKQFLTFYYTYLTPKEFIRGVLRKPIEKAEKHKDCKTRINRAIWKFKQTYPYE